MTGTQQHIVSAEYLLGVTGATAPTAGPFRFDMSGKGRRATRAAARRNGRRTDGPDRGSPGHRVLDRPRRSAENGPLHLRAERADLAIAIG